MYSSPSLSDHSQNRLPSLIRPQISAAPATNVFMPPSYHRHLSNVATFSWQIGWPYQRGITVVRHVSEVSSIILQITNLLLS